MSIQKIVDTTEEREGNAIIATSPFATQRLSPVVVGDVDVNQAAALLNDRWTILRYYDGDGALGPIGVFPAQGWDVWYNMQSARGVATGGSRQLVSSSNQYFYEPVQLGHHDVASQDFSLAAWVYCDTDVSHPIISNGGMSATTRGFALRIDQTTRYVTVALNDNDATTSAFTFTSITIPLSRWYYIVVTFDRSGSMSLYVDGVWVESLDMTSRGGNLDGDYVLSVGREQTTNYYCDGRIARVAQWTDRVLTGADIIQLYNGGSSLLYAQLTDGLKTDLVSYYNCTEQDTSDVLIDQHGGYDLLPYNAPTNDFGPTVELLANSASPGYYRHLTAANSEYWDYSGDDFDVGVGDFTFACRLYLDTSAGNMVLWADGADGSGDNGIQCHVNSSNQVVLQIDDGSETTYTFTADTIVDTVWAHIIITADRSGNATLYINGEFVESQSIVGSNGNAAGLGTLTIGSAVTPGDYFNGRLSHVGMWRVVLTSDQVTSLYNAGLPLNSNYLSAGLLVGLIEYFDGFEGVDGSDLVGGINTITCSANNSPGIGSFIAANGALRNVVDPIAAWSLDIPDNVTVTTSLVLDGTNDYIEMDLAD